jgi:hypothetical protein
LFSDEKFVYFLIMTGRSRGWSPAALVSMALVDTFFGPGIKGL